MQRPTVVIVLLLQPQAILIPELGIFISPIKILFLNVMQ